jgi:hypothetical protein
MNDLMNLARQLGAHRVALANIAALLLLGLAAHASAGVEHHTELQPGEKLLIADHHKSVETYRVCIPDMPGDVRLKVIHDGDVSEVLDGTCETFTAKKIDVKVDSKLPAGDSLGMKISTVKG